LALEVGFQFLKVENELNIVGDVGGIRAMCRRNRELITTGTDSEGGVV
jgi:hypothetical protein